jgi:hypothetical protein
MDMTAITMTITTTAIGAADGASAATTIDEKSPGYPGLFSWHKNREPCHRWQG